MTGILEGLFSRTATKPETRGEYWQEQLAVVGGGSSAGISVTPGSALTSSAVFACVRILAETIASLPLIVYERKGKGRDRAVNFYLYPVLHDNPNEYMTSFELRETLQGHLALWGNAFSQLDYDAAGRITSIFPLRPDRMREIRLENGQKYYHYQLPNGQFIWLSDDKVWHLKAFGDGIWGYSPVELLRNAIGLNMALEKFGSKFFGNGARPGGVLEHPGTLGENAQKSLRASWNEMHAGLDNSHKVAILEEGMKWHDIGIPPEDAQFLETRKFQLNEISRIYRIPPHMIADLEKATFSNIEQQDLEFVKYTMFPWLKRWEQSIHTNLLMERERKKYYVEFLVDGLLRGDNASRSNFYATAKQWGWMSTNEIREKENMNPVEGGDVYLVPMNMIPATDVGIQQAPNQQEGSQVQEQKRQANTDKKEVALRRLNIARSYKRVLNDAAERSLKRQVVDIKQASDKYLKRNDVDGFNAWLNQYYEDMPDVIKKVWEPAFRGLGEAINAAAASEVHGPVGMTPGLEECLQYHLDRAVARDILVSKNLIDTIMTNSVPKADSRILNDAIGEWVNDRAPAFASWESTRISGLMTKATYFYNDVRDLQWIQLDENPFCATLNSNVISMGQSCRGTHFVTKDDEIQAIRSGKILRPSWNVATPPLFLGCECQIVAGI